MTRDYYELLQIQPDAAPDEIHKAYRVLAMQHHPDRNATPDAASRMAEINEAYSILSEPASRRQYDEKRNSSRQFDVAGPILHAAREALLKQGWIVSNDDGVNLVLEQGLRSVRVSLL